MLWRCRYCLRRRRIVQLLGSWLRRRVPWKRIWTFCWERSMCRVQRFGISWRLSSLRLISKGRVRSFGRWPIGFFLRIEGHRCVRCGVRIAVWVFCVRSDAGAGVLWEIYLLVAILCSGSCQLIMHEVRRRSMFRVRRWWFVQGSSCNDGGHVRWRRSRAQLYVCCVSKDEYDVWVREHKCRLLTDEGKASTYEAITSGFGFSGNVTRNL